MKKKIAISTVCALVILISMTSTLFAGSVTNYFTYKFWNCDPTFPTSTSYGVTYLNSISGIEANRQLQVQVKIWNANNAYTNLRTNPTTTPSFSPNLSVSVNSDSTLPRRSWHLDYMYDNVNYMQTFTTTYIINTTLSGNQYI